MTRTSITRRLQQQEDLLVVEMFEAMDVIDDGRVERAVGG
jgi:hypothetical protein